MQLYQNEILGLTHNFCQQSNEELTMINFYNEIQTCKMRSVLLGMWQKNFFQLYQFKINLCKTNGNSLKSNRYTIQQSYNCTCWF